MKTIQEMTPEQKAYHDKCLAEYRLGGYKHESFVLNHTFGMGSKKLGLVTPAIVGMGQDGDPYYTQYFQNWTEVNEFIQELKNSSTEAWGEQMKTIQEMAREAGFGDYAYEATNLFKAFAELVREDAIAEEREAITDEYWMSVQSDLEHGVKCLSERAAKQFQESMPELSKFGEWLEARNGK